jgi:hypothetical protein
MRMKFISTKMILLKSLNLNGLGNKAGKRKKTGVSNAGPVISPANVSAFESGAGSDASHE